MKDVNSLIEAADESVEITSGPSLRTFTFFRGKWTIFCGGTSSWGLRLRDVCCRSLTETLIYYK